MAAAYALYEKKMAIASANAQLINQKNSSSSTGAIGRESENEFFSPEEVRLMSREEVRKNYSKIIDSMKKWN